MKKLVTLTASLILVLNLHAQDVDNITFQKVGTKVFISYDLKAPYFTKWTISVYSSKDGGMTWRGPLEKLTGEFGTGVKPGKKKKITWDLEAEKMQPDGQMNLKVEASRYRGPEVCRPYAPSYYRYRRSEDISLASAMVFTAAGFYFLKQGDHYYTRYQTAESNAGDLHQKIDMYDKFYPAAFGIAGLCAVNFVYKIFQKNKAKRTPLTVQPLPLQKGGGIGMIYNF